MPKGKDIYSVLSKKHAAKQKRIKEAAELRKKKKTKAVAPPKVDNYQSKPTFAKSLNYHPRINEIQRKISPNEGRPVVNASQDVDRFIHKPKQNKGLDAGLAAITKEDLVVEAPKKRGRPRKRIEESNVKRENKKTTRARDTKVKESRKTTPRRRSSDNEGESRSGPTRP
jgi:hypothetical protein